MLKTTMSLVGIAGLGVSVAWAAITGFPHASANTDPSATVTQDRDEHDGDKDDDDDDDGGDKESKAKTMKLDELPAEAMAAIKKAAGKNKITGINSEEAGTFEAAWKVGETEREIVVASNGTILERERTIALDEAPEAVRKMVKKKFPKGSKVVVEKKTMIFYSAEAMVGDKEHEILLTGTGQPVKIEALRQKQENDGDDEEDDDHDGSDDHDGDHDGDDDGGTAS
jgi:hypothetical protein